jgi:catechol 2,3-dioxygenase-like lactoylglutathione lyase family enzyme
MMIDHIDHVVLTTRDLPACLRFYSEVLGMKHETFQTPKETRIALKFGNQKINVHEWGKEFSPRAHVAAPGTLDLCFIASVPLEKVIEKLQQSNITIIEGPVMKTGAVHKLRSVYVRDPDMNLVEISVAA